MDNIEEIVQLSFIQNCVCFIAPVFEILELFAVFDVCDKSVINNRVGFNAEKSFFYLYLFFEHSVLRFSCSSSTRWTFVGGVVPCRRGMH